MKTLVVISICLLSSAAFALTGISSGGGSDRPRSASPLDDFAWFIGTRPVKACLQMDANYGVSQIALANDVRHTFDLWVSYLNRRAFNVRTQHIAQTIELKEDCAGDEDLKIEFGTSTPEVLRAKGKYVDPAGLSEVTEANSNAYSRGFIWIDRMQTSDQRAEDQIFGLLLHEMGHTFGNQHVDGTIMDRNIAGQLLTPWLDLSQLRAQAHSIDQVRELVSCFTCRSTYFQLEKSDEDDITLFKTLVGRLPVGPFEVKLVDGPGMRIEDKITSVEGYDVFPKDVLAVVLKDAAGSKTIPIQPKERSSTDATFELGHIFTIVKTAPGSSSSYSSPGSSESEISAVVQDAKGVSHDVTLTINGGGRDYLLVQVELENRDGYKTATLLASGPVYGFGDRDAEQSLLRTCSIDTLEPFIRSDLLSSLLEMKHDLVASSLSFKRGASRLFQSHLFYDYAISIRDANGAVYQVATYIAERKSNKLGARAGGFVTSDAILTKQTVVNLDGGGTDALDDGIIGNCDSQSLAMVSLFSSSPKKFAIRLVDAHGKPVGEAKSVDLLDRELRAASVPVYEN